jgi:hypothetical protein
MSYILGSFLINVLSIAMRFALNPLALVSHELLGVILLCREYLDRTFAMLHSIFEFS